MSIITTMPLFSSLCLTEMVEEAGQDEKKNAEITRLVSNLLSRATKAFLDRKFVALDPNPADDLCQLRGILLYAFSQREDLRSEARNLQVLVKQKKLEQIALSDEMLFVLRCYLLKVTRVTERIESNGIVVTKTDIGSISMLAKRVNNLFNKPARQNFVLNNSRGLNLQSIKGIQAIAKTLGDPLIAAGLSTITETRCDPYPSKYSCSLLYQVKAILEYLKKENGLIAIKSIETKDKPIRIFVKASAEGFVKISEASLKDPNETLVVFEAVLDEEQFNSRDFENILLACVDAPPPYFQLDHVYCSSLKEEGVKNVQTT